MARREKRHSSPSLRPGSSPVSASARALSRSRESSSASCSSVSTSGSCAGAKDARPTGAPLSAPIAAGGSSASRCVASSSATRRLFGVPSRREAWSSLWASATGNRRNTGARSDPGYRVISRRYHLRREGAQVVERAVEQVLAQIEEPSPERRTIGRRVYACGRGKTFQRPHEDGELEIG